MSTSHSSYHVSTPSGSSSRPPAVDRPFVPPSSPRASASRSLISPLPSAQDPQRADRQTPKGASIIHEDDDCVAYLERDRALASAGHLTLIISPPLPTIYDFHPSQVPLLVRLLALTRTLLDRHSLALPLSAQPSRRSSRDGLGPPPSPMESTLSLAPSSPTLALPSPTSFPPRAPGGRSRLQERIGFVVSPFKDPLNAGQPNLTLHAMLGPLDRASFWTRAGAFGPLGFYSLDDLIAEIRESTSNNRIKSGEQYGPPTPTSAAPQTERYLRPIDQAIGAGARHGEANGVEYNVAALAPTTKDAPPSPAARPASSPRSEKELAGSDRYVEDDGDLADVSLDKGKEREH